MPSASEGSRASGAPDEADQPAGQAGPLPWTGDVHMGTKCVLVADQDVLFRQTVRGMLRETEYEVAEAADGLEGLGQAEEVRPAAILLEATLPAIDGFAVCRALKEKVITRAIPVVFLTPRPDETLRDLAYLAGGTACLSKPFRRDALVAVLDAVISNAQRKARADRPSDTRTTEGRQV